MKYWRVSFRTPSKHTPNKYREGVIEFSVKKSAESFFEEIVNEPWFDPEFCKLEELEDKNH